MNHIYGYVYLITNTINGKVYVGQTTATLATRWRQHKWEGKQQDASMLISRAIRKYGIEAFNIQEINKAYSQNELDALEIEAIRQYDSTNRNKGYNVLIGGRTLSVEERKLKGAKRRGIPRSEEVRKKISEGHIG